MVILVAAALAAAGPQVGAAAPVVEEVVAVVRNPAGAPPRAITLTKLTEEARIALVGRGAVEAAYRPLDAPALRAALDWLVDQLLVADEASRLRVDDIGREDVLAEVRRFEARFASPDAYRRFLAASDLSEEELAVTLARTLRVHRYLKTRAARATGVSDDEVERFLRERNAPSTAVARDAARARLAEGKWTEQVKGIVAELRARAEVRVIAPPGGERGG
jgi:hypothetical protein